jgi:hypothetical protein
MQRVKQIKRRITEIRGTADGIGTEAEALRDEVHDALLAIEDAISKVPVSASVV